MLADHGMWFFPCVLVSGYSLQNVSDIIRFTSWKKLCLVHSQSSGLLFTEQTLTFPSKSSYHAQVLVPLAAQINLSLILGNSNKIFPLCSALNCSQPNFFIRFISLCVQKDCINNKGFIALSPQT